MRTHSTITGTLAAKVNIRFLGVAFLSVLFVGLTGCASDDMKTSAVPKDERPTAASGAPERQNESAVLAATAASTPGSTPAALDDNPSLVAVTPFSDALAIVAKVTVNVDDVRKTVVDLPSLVEGKGGSIYDTDIQVGDPITATATVTIKVPPRDLESLIASLADIGTLVSRTQQTEDVATQIVDVNVRILTAQASVDRIRVLLADAKSLQDITAIEAEVTARETTLEQLLAQQRNLAGRVQLATLTATFAPTPPEADVVVAKIEPSKPQTVGGAWHDGWQRFTKIAHGVGVALAYSLPFLVIAGVVGLVGWIFRRRPTRSASSTAPSPTQSPT